MKVLYALVFALLPLAAVAQTLDISPTAAYELDDLSWDSLQQSTLPAQLVTGEPTIQKLDLNGDAAITAEEGSDGISLGEKEPYETLAVPATLLARIAASEPWITDPQEILEEIGELAMTGTDDGEDFSVGAFKARQETQTAARALASEPAVENYVPIVDETDGIVSE